MRASELAKYLINEYHKKNKIISNLVLQKIMYLIQNKLLKENFNGSDVIEDEFEAWQYGPVIRQLYIEYVSFGGMDLSIFIPKEDITRFEKSINVEVKKIIDNIIEKYIKIYPWDLVRLTHIANGAWQKTMSNNSNVYGGIIPKDMIKGDIIENN
ncbi:Panacea domain-containing protein [Caviibacter abscessus]|uniref:Panacea domain-containing protein n=1 Tax=Caviibacter abscessus TaxID=1766719 RepID=UPI00083814D2|nr:type II toxin-antitoxin system antitoxin SocA domain-containing protein [Caviibacter abscessus]